jgi:hypothetical protein
MSRLTAISALASVAGLTLLFSEVPWFSRISRIDRLAPYQPGTHRVGTGGVFSVASFRDVIGPLSRSVGERMARLCGFDEDLQIRLVRVHSSLDVTGFRVRQIGLAASAIGVGTLAAVALAPRPEVSAILVVGAPILTFLVVEQRLALASAAWQRRIFLELPVITEQLAMLISAGWSLGAAIGRVAERGSGACSQDLVRVQTRMRQGLSEIDALQEWASLACVDELDGLIAILALNRETADLGRLISDEARSIRRQAQRELIETIEKRTQQVWIPVTVAALVPGVLLMGVPFIDALSLFST